MTEIPAWLKSQRSVPVKDDPARWPRDVEKAFDDYAAHRPLGGDYASPVQIDHGDKIRIRMPVDYTATRKCTCHPDDAPVPCQHLYATSECLAAAKRPLFTVEKIARCAVQHFDASAEAERIMRGNMLSDMLFYGLVPLTPWRRFVNRWKYRALRLPDAWAVLMGRKFATED